MEWPNIVGTLQKHFIKFDWLISIQLERSVWKINMISKLECPHLPNTHSFTLFKTQQFDSILDQLYNACAISKNYDWLARNIYKMCVYFFFSPFCPNRIENERKKKWFTICREITSDLTISGNCLSTRILIVWIWPPAEMARKFYSFIDSI